MISFRLMRQEHLAQVLRWRTAEDITRCLFTDLDQPSLEKQEAWFDKISQDQTCKYWVICNKSDPVGVLFLTNLTRQHRRASYGFYIGEPDHRRLAGFIPPLFYNFAFDPCGLALTKLWWEVFSFNKPVLELHQRHGAREVGVLTNHVLKNLKWHDVVLFELLSDEWAKNSQRQGAQAEWET